MKMPGKVRVTYGGHVIEGEVQVSTAPSDEDKANYSMSLTGGYFVCGPHDAEGNHLEGEA